MVKPMPTFDANENAMYLLLLHTLLSTLLEEYVELHKEFAVNKTTV